jgi:hypothetical protein
MKRLRVNVESSYARGEFRQGMMLRVASVDNHSESIAFEVVHDPEEQKIRETAVAFMDKGYTPENAIKAAVALCAAMGQP